MKTLKSVLIAALSFILFTGIIIPKSTSSAKREYSGEQLYAGFTTDTGAFAHHLSDGLKNQIFIQKNPKSTLNGRKDYQKKLNAFVYKKNPAYFKQLKKAFYRKDYLTAQKLIYTGEKYNNNFYKQLILNHKFQNTSARKVRALITDTAEKGKVSFQVYTKVQDIVWVVNAGLVANAAVAFNLVLAEFLSNKDSLNSQMITKNLVNEAQ